MSDKALEFEDFILDDYDFNVYTDWDLMDLWEWVELDDFSDLEHNRGAQHQPPPAHAPKPHSHAPPPQHISPETMANSANKKVDNIMSEMNDTDIQPDIDSLLGDMNMQSPDAPPHHPTSTMQDVTTEPESISLDDDDDFDFDFDFGDDMLSDDPPATSQPSPGDSPSISTSNNIAPPPTPQADSISAPPENSTENSFDDDFDFDFDFSDDDIPETTALQKESQNTSLSTVTSKQAPASHVPSAPPAQTAQHNDDDFDFDFDFSDDGQEFQDFETSDTLDLDMTSDTETLSDDSLNFNFDLESDDNGFGTGGYTPEPPPLLEDQEEDATDETEPRYIETSAGTLDIETDNILSFLQQLEFDEFLETLQLHPHVYDRIMESDQWSKEEMEFLRSIEPLVKDAEKVAQIREQKAKEEEAEKEAAKHRMPETTGYEDQEKSAYDGRSYASDQEMHNSLNDRALDAALNRPRPVTLMPARLCAEWGKDTDTKRSSRVGRKFNRHIKHTPPNKQKPWLKHIPHLPAIQTGKHERYYDELSTIINNELHAMCSQLDKDSINFIKADGQRFGDQFTDFLLEKYGTKILFLYRSQMENDLLADKMFEDFHDLFSSQLDPEYPEDYTQKFFRSVLTHMKTHNITV